MATTTTNFGWDIPQSTDLVKDGATAIAALGQDIDTALVDLKGGTTGQVLAKASGTDLDFSWVAQDDSNAIQNAIVDAKGDLIGATAADTPARLAVGTNGQVLTADSTAATGLAWATATSGSMTVLASGSLSGSSIVLSSISGSYKDLRLVCRDVFTSNTTGMNIRLNNDTSSNYRLTGTLNIASGGPNFVIGGEDSRWEVTNTTMAASDNNNSMIFDLFDYADGTSQKLGTCTTSFTSSGNGRAMVNQGLGYYSTTAITRIDFYVGSGTFSGGTYVLYGVN
jgi:hypothetical protein